jgi:phosphatidate cytidylyltransferase
LFGNDGCALEANFCSDPKRFLTMSPASAVHDPVFRVYLMIVPLTLLIGGVVLVFLQYVLGKELGSIWATYRSWIVMAFLGLLFVFLGRLAVIAGVCVLSIAAFRELARVSGLQHDHWLTSAVYIGIVAIAVATLINYPLGEEPTTGRFSPFQAVPVFAITLILIIPIIRNRAGRELPKLALSIVGFIYVGWMFGHLGFLANATHAYGLICYIIFATELNDVSAFTFGRLFGRHPLRSEISPSKTVEGALGALAVSMILPWLFRFSFPFFGATQLILTGLIVGVGALLGDLSISMIKRDLGTKDMGTVIPGHGGVLDRIDSLIYVAPLFMHMTNYYYGLR